VAGPGNEDELLAFALMTTATRVEDLWFFKRPDGRAVPACGYRTVDMTDNCLESMSERSFWHCLFSSVDACMPVVAITLAVNPVVLRYPVWERDQSPVNGSPKSMNQKTHFYPLAILCCSSLLPVATQAAAESVSVVAIQVTRPAAPDPYVMPGTSITLDVTLEGKSALGLHPDSAITSLRDDTGKDLFAEGAAMEAEMERELVAAMGGVIDGGGTLTRKDTGGNIDHAQAVHMRDPDRGAVQVPVITLGLPASGATRLHAKGELAIQVAGAGERRVRVENVTMDRDWGNDFEVDGQAVRCSSESYSQDGDVEVSSYYCWQADVIRVEVVGQTGTVPDRDYNRANLFILGPAENLTLDFVMPELETVRVPVDLEFGLGL
jgi:hypothetical protein